MTPFSLGDQPVYDTLALEIGRLHGFRYDFSDPDFKLPFLAANRPVPHNYSHITAFRPPLYPTIVGIAYRLTGERFWPARLINIIAISIAFALTALIVLRLAGPIPALIVLLIMDFDGQITTYSSLILTESVAMLLVTCIVWTLVNILPHYLLRGTVLLALFTALAILQRQAFILWVPVLALLPPTFLFYGRHPSNRGNWSRFLGLYLVGVFLLLSPWMLRNLLITGCFNPLGTRGFSDLVQGYSDRAIDTGGADVDNLGVDYPNWYPQYYTRYKSLPPSLEKEIALSEGGKALVKDWVKANYRKIPKLTLRKIKGEWHPYNGTREYIMYFLMFVGAVTLVYRWEGKVLVSLLVVQTIVVALTYSSQGRFILPARPIMAILAGVATWILFFLLPKHRLTIDQWLDSTLNRISDHPHASEGAKGSSLKCAVERCWSSVGAIPTRQLGRSSR